MMWHQQVRGREDKGYIYCLTVEVEGGEVRLKDSGGMRPGELSFDEVWVGTTDMARNLAAAIEEAIQRSLT